MHTFDIQQQENDDKYPQVPAAVKETLQIINGRLIAWKKESWQDYDLPDTHNYLEIIFECTDHILVEIEL